MINKKEILQLIKDATMKMAGLYQKEEFKSWTDAELKISQREVGGKVEVIGAQGELSPAADGEYEMEDGFKFTVKDGQIASIEGEEAPAEEKKAEEQAPVEQAEEAPTQEEPKEEAPAEEPSKEVEELKAKVAQLEGVVAGLVQAIEELKGAGEVAATKEDVDNFSNQVAELNDTIKQLAKVPVEFSKTSKNNTVKDHKDEKLFELARVIGSTRK